MSVFVPVGGGSQVVTAVAAASGTPIVASGSIILALPTIAKNVKLIVNVKTATGTTPSIVFQLQEIDPGDQTTVLGDREQPTGNVLTGVGVDTSVQINDAASTYFKVSWTVTGTTPSFAVNATLVGKIQ